MAHDIDDPGYRPYGTVNLAGFLARSTVNGPGTRAVIWVQGCPNRCPGCFNPEFQLFPSSSASERVKISDLAESVLSLENIDGVTFSGGEPFSQAAPLAELGGILKEHGLSVMTYTGFTLEEIRNKNRSSWERLLSITDILIAGPFIRELRCSRNGLTGSSNQQVIPLVSGRLVSASAAGKADERVEFSITRQGRVTITGFPDHRLIKKIATACGVR